MNNLSNATSNSAATDRYFVSINGTVKGPFVQSELLIHATPDALVWQVGQSA
jgi:hypothetical protein